jgi:hypothetical protein
MRAAIETEGSDKVRSLTPVNVRDLDRCQRWYDYRQLFNSAGARHRSFLVLCIGFFGQIDLPPTRYVAVFKSNKCC